LYELQKIEANHKKRIVDLAVFSESHVHKFVQSLSPGLKTRGDFYIDEYLQMPVEKRPPTRKCIEELANKLVRLETGFANPIHNGRDVAVTTNITSSFQTSNYGDRRGSNSSNLSNASTAFKAQGSATAPPNDYRNNRIAPDGSKTNGQSQRKCFRCNQIGHMARDCPLNGNNPSKSTHMNAHAFLASGIDGSADEYNTESPQDFLNRL
jgi:Zinc knuckle